MKWKLTFLGGVDRPNWQQEIEADSWTREDGMWVHFYREGNPKEKLVAAFRADLLRSIELVEDAETSAP